MTLWMYSRFTRRARLVIGGLALAMVGVAGVARPAHAQAYPSKPIRIIVAVAPGGPTDLLARLIGQKLTEAWGQAVIVENRPGAGQLIGTGVAAKAPPDGYTLLMTTNTFPVNTWLFKNLPYDPKKDFEPVTEVASSSLVLLVNASLNVHSVKELIDYARANPGKLNFGSSGPSSSLRLAVELLKSMAGIDMKHVPFQGAAPMMTALMGGIVQVAVVDLSTSAQQIASGRVRALAVTNAHREPTMPAIPTMSESGLPGYAAESWFGLLAPAGTPVAVVNKIQTEVAAILKQPQVRERLKSFGEVGIGSTPSEFAAYIDAESVKWKKVIQDNRITAE